MAVRTPGAGDEFALDHHRLDDLHGKTEAQPQIAEGIHVSLLAMPKAEILAHENLRRFQLLHQNTANELFGSEFRQGAVEAQDQSGFQANGGESLHSLADGFDQRRSIRRDAAP